MPLPPGPRAPVPLQTLAMLSRQRPYLERQRRRHGEVFTVASPASGHWWWSATPCSSSRCSPRTPRSCTPAPEAPCAQSSDPARCWPSTRTSHLEQRRLLLPPFKGPAHEGLRAARWRRSPSTSSIASRPASRSPTAAMFMRITLRTILRAVFGATGRTLPELEALLPPWTAHAQSLARFPLAAARPRAVEPVGAPPRLRARDRRAARRARSTRRAATRRSTARVDILALLVRARHEDGPPMPIARSATSS